MEISMFNAIKNQLISFLKGKNYQTVLKKIWIYNEKFIVVDFFHRGIGFNFDVIPSKNNLISIDIVQRRSVSGNYLTSTGTRKVRIGKDIELEKALDLLDIHASQFLLRINAYLDEPVTPLPSRTRKPMKIGVMTLPLNRNFGGNLQAFAMMEALRKLGHQPILINRRHSRVKKGIDGDKFDVLESVQLLPSSYGMNPSIPNSSFIDKYINPFTKQFNSTFHISRDIGQYNLDAMIVGSDQVWRAKYARDILRDFFLGFLPEDDRSIRRISYAASFGADRLAYGAEGLREAARLIQKFDAVSVREDSAVEICRKYLGVEAQHVLDPTLLLSPNDYVNLFADKKDAYSGNRLLAYVLDSDDDKGKLIADISARLSLSAYATNGLPFGSVSALKTDDGDRSIEGWLASFHGAAFIVTDSFHGAVFSILFNKPFIAYGNPKRGIARFNSLVKMFGLEDRFVVNSAEIDLEKMLRPIDWNTVNARLDSLRKKSLQFIELALSTEKNRIVVEAPSGKLGLSDKVRQLAQLDAERYSIALMKNNLSSVRSKIMFNAHAIEKGLSHSNFRAGFGIKPIGRLAKFLNQYIEFSGPIDDIFFKSAISVMKSYFERHKEINYDVGSFWKLFSADIQRLIINSDEFLGGVLKASDARGERIAHEGGRSFLDVVYSRRSVREFTQEPVDIKDIRHAVHIASQSPSVCNRQGVRVHYFTEKEKISSLIDLQGGFGGYKKPLSLLLVTCELTAFIQAKERNQAFIDGGLFLMGLLLGLEHVGLGACPLNTMMDIEREKEIREFLKIPETEVLISFVAIGNYASGILVPRSIRFPVDEILTVQN